MRSALSAARGLAQLHTVHNLVHGNVKASNVLLRPDADATALSDFSLHQLFAPSTTRAGEPRAAIEYCGQPPCAFLLRLESSLSAVASSDAPSRITWPTWAGRTWCCSSAIA